MSVLTKFSVLTKMSVLTGIINFKKNYFILQNFMPKNDYSRTVTNKNGHFGEDANFSKEVHGRFEKLV